MRAVRAANNCVYTVKSDPHGAFKTPDGRCWDVMIFGEVTCDGTLLFRHNLVQTARQEAAKFLAKNQGMEQGEEVQTERHHRANMAYGKNADVVTWSVFIPIRRSEGGEA